MEGMQKRRIFFHLLEHGKPMTNFEHMKGLFDFLKVHHTPKRHWIELTN